MSDSNESVLREIVDLLRRQTEIAERRLRLEQEAAVREARKIDAAEAARRIEKSLESIPIPEIPKFEFDEEHKQQMARIEREAEATREEIREFHQRILAEMERHATALERILATLANKGSETA